MPLSSRILPLSEKLVIYLYYVIEGEGCHERQVFAMKGGYVPGKESMHCERPTM